jgi:cytochrome c-type biogenesis protein CcmE
VKRLRLVLVVAGVAASLGWVAARGLSGGLVYYVTPTELVHRGPAAVGERLRLGGLVAPGSVREAGETVRFVVTDGTTRVTVVGTGGVPALFREGQGVVVEGVYRADGTFAADTVLVKHGTEYRPPRPGETPTAALLEGGS